MTMMQSVNAFLPAAPAVGGFVAGTQIMTLDGALPVEFLSPGDRIVTRAGVRKLTGVSVRAVKDVAMVRIGAGTLGHDRPREATLVPADQMILIRDWRAKALYGADQILIPAARLIDGEMICREDAAEIRLFTLEFDCDAVVYADGLEAACLRVAVAA